jgi:hypothetical protein
VLNEAKEDAAIIQTGAVPLLLTSVPRWVEQWVYCFMVDFSDAALMVKTVKESAAHITGALKGKGSKQSNIKVIERLEE